MSGRVGLYSGRRFFFTVALPSLCVALLLVLGAFSAIRWAVKAADRAEIGRQVALMSVVVDNLRASIAHDQESVTVWDEAVLAMQHPTTPNWIDVSLGSWMHAYFGHDGAYILDSTDTPVYAYDAGSVAPLATYEHIRPVAARLAADLRRRLAAGDTEGISDKVLSLGESDIGFDEGRPAIISVKPIVSDTGTIEQTPGTEYLHVAVRLLDGSFLQELSGKYLFRDLSYTPVALPQEGWEDYPIHNAAGGPVGYFVWRPFSPGTEVLGRIGPVAAGGSLLLLAAVAVALLSVHRRAVSEHAAAERIHRLAFRDPLTDLPNRTAFEQRASGNLEPLPERGALLYIDLDHFKVINDTLGHAVGDIVVRAVAERIEAICGRETYRMGGDEFAVVASGSTVRDAAAMAEAVIAALSSPVLIGEVHAFVGASVGVVSLAEPGAGGFELFRKADVALNHAKDSGRGRVAVYDQAMDAELRGRAAIERDLRRAIAHPEEFEVHYQPVYDAAARHVASVEALVRWRHPERGMIPPADFIPIAENSGLIREIGVIVLEAACRAAVRWAIPLVAVNVSAVQLRGAEFPGVVADVLHRAGLPPERLEIEITETAWLDPSGYGNETVAALRAIGVKIALDDFGTGFSSLGRLSETVFDRIKIDQSFVRRALASPHDAAVIQAIVDLARAYGSKTTAEGVETAEEAEFLTRIGCDELQGYWFSRPLPFAEIDERFSAAADLV